MRRSGTLRGSSKASTVDIACSGGGRSANPDADIYATINIWVGSSKVATSTGFGPSPTVYAHFEAASVDYDRPISCDLQAGFGYAYASGTLLADCGNVDVTNLRNEYRSFTVDWIPNCNEFQEIGVNEFNHSEDNTHQPWAIVKDIVYVKRAEVQEYALYQVRITSSYRCPHINASIPNSAHNSHHMKGDALDMTPPSNRWSPPTETEFNHLHDAAAQTGPRFITDWSTYSDRHLHCDWGG